MTKYRIMKLKHYIFFLFAAVAVTISADDADDNIYFRMIDDAQYAIKTQDYERAEQLITEAINFQPDNPNNALLMSNLGMVRYYMGNDSLALYTLNHAHSLAPASVTILQNRARVLSSIGKIDEAVADYDKITELDSTVVMPYLFRGLLYLGNSDLLSAQMQFENITKYAPGSYEEALAYSNFYFLQQDYANALKYYGTLLKTEQTAENYAAHAICCLYCDDLDTASMDISAGLAIDDKYGELYLCRAILYKKRYMNEDAFRDAQQAKKLGVNPETVDSMLNFKK